MKINFKKLIKYIIITFLIGSLFAVFVNDTDFYNGLNKGIDVPSIVFPIVWSILYLIMGITSYIVSSSKDISKNDALKIYFIQLVVNSLWTLLFFGFKLLTFSFIWIIFLIVLVVIMIIKFYTINKLSGILNIPYLFWLLCAAYLNLSIVILM